jgi:hypothetical protein
VLRALLSVLVLTASTIVMPVTANPLSKHQWSQRPLLVFAASENANELQRLRRALSGRRCEIAERDMVIIETLGEERTVDGRPVESATAAGLRRRFAVEDDAFTVILVGKDGTEKLRSQDVPDLDAVFSLIDGMPMRRLEMQEQERACRQ